jgi:hypothetical protein
MRKWRYRNRDYIAISNRLRARVVDRINEERDNDRIQEKRKAEETLAAIKSLILELIK